MANRPTQTKPSRPLFTVSYIPDGSPFSTAPKAIALSSAALEVRAPSTRSAAAACWSRCVLTWPFSHAPHTPAARV